MAYSADSFVADEQPTTAKWNKRWNNDASFNDGSGIASLAWGTTSLSNVYKFRARRVAAQNTSAGAAVKINFDTEDFDTNSNYDNATNYRYTAAVAGFYPIWGHVNTSAAGSLLIILYKNGSAYQRGGQMGSSGGVICSDFVQSAATDYWEQYVFSASTGAIDVTAAVQPYFAAHLHSRT